MAIVLRDQTALRAAPRDSAPQQAQLWQGEVVEVRGERLDYLQVWDHVRERGGFVRASQVHRSRLGAADAPGLLTLMAFTRQSSGQEALGIGLTAAYLQASASRPATRRTRPPRRRSLPTSKSRAGTVSTSRASSATAGCRFATTAMPSGASSRDPPSRCNRRAPCWR
jgi:hypothetical protein